MFHELTTDGNKPTIQEQIDFVSEMIKVGTGTEYIRMMKAIQGNLIACRNIETAFHAIGNTNTEMMEFLSLQEKWTTPK